MDVWKHQPVKTQSINISDIPTSIDLNLAVATIMYHHFHLIKCQIWFKQYQTIANRRHEIAVGLREQKREKAPKAPCNPTSNNKNDDKTSHIIKH